MRLEETAWPGRILLRLVLLGALSVLDARRVLAGAPNRGLDRITEAERLAAGAVELAATKPEDGIAKARQSLTLTAEFEPTAYVKTGRKGEVVEDAFVAAREEYRRHRARLYRAVGRCLSRASRPQDAARYLRRALELDGDAAGVAELAQALVATGGGREALDVLLAHSGGTLGPEAQAVASEAANAVGLPSLQAELDRVRLLALPVQPRIEVRDGPFRTGGRERLSTGSLLALEGNDASIAIYIADAACRSCSGDLELLKRATPPTVPIWLSPAAPDKDQVLRQAMSLYRYNWPVIVGPGLGTTFGLPAPSVLFLARRGYLGAIVRPPFSATLPPVFETLARAEIQEDVPRAAWNRRSVERKPPAPRPALLPEGLAPGEDEPARPEFTKAVEAYRASRYKEALLLFEGLEALGDGWLLPPEARLNRALCLSGLGQREPARLMLLRLGDSRFQEAVDRTLERVGSSGRRP